MTLGEIIRSKMIELDVTNLELGKRVKVCQGTLLANLKKEPKYVKKSLLHKIGAFLSIPPEVW